MSLAGERRLERQAFQPWAGAWLCQGGVDVSATLNSLIWRCQPSLFRS